MEHIFSQAALATYHYAYSEVKLDTLEALVKFIINGAIDDFSYMVPIKRKEINLYKSEIEQLKTIGLEEIRDMEIKVVNDLIIKESEDSIINQYSDDMQANVYRAKYLNELHERIQRVKDDDTGEIIERIRNKKIKSLEDLIVAAEGGIRDVDRSIDTEIEDLNKPISRSNTAYAVFKIADNWGDVSWLGNKILEKTNNVTDTRLSEIFSPFSEIYTVIIPVLQPVVQIASTATMSYYAKSSYPIVMGIQAATNKGLVSIALGSATATMEKLGYNIEQYTPNQDNIKIADIVASTSMSFFQGYKYCSGGPGLKCVAGSAMNLAVSAITDLTSSKEAPMGTVTLTYGHINPCYFIANLFNQAIISDIIKIGCDLYISNTGDDQYADL